MSRRPGSAPRAEPEPHRAAAQRRQPEEQPQPGPPQVAQHRHFRHRRPVQQIDAGDARQDVRVPRPMIAGEQFRRADVRPAVRAACARSSRVAMSRRLMFSPCAPIGGMTCAASATSAVRGPFEPARSAWATIGQRSRALARIQPAEHAAGPRVQRRGEVRLRHRGEVRGRVRPAFHPDHRRMRPAVVVGQRHQA